MDADKITFPLVIRKWKKGDYFVPLGMKSKKKKISDYFIDNKYTVLQKEESWLLTSNNEIVWLIGKRSDERFKIQSVTKKIIVLEIK